MVPEVDAWSPVARYSYFVHGVISTFNGEFYKSNIVHLPGRSNLSLTFPFRCIVLQFPACSIIVRDALSCCDAHSDETQARWLASDPHHSDICDPPLELAEENVAGCDPHKWHAIHTLEDVLFSCTISILSFMMLELLVLMAAISPCTFFRHFWYDLDFIIVAVSLGLEASFYAIDDDQLATYIGALIIFRCWRFVRISHGLIEMTAEVTSEKYHKVVKKAMELEGLLAEHDRKMIAEGRDDDTDSIIEIRVKTKELGESLVATEAEDRDEIHIDELTKKIKGAVHLSLHKSRHGQEEQADDGDADAENPVGNDEQGS